MIKKERFASKREKSAVGPPSEDGPIVVDIGFLLSNINGINEEAETFDFEGVLSMHWHDDRLAFDPAKTGYDQLYIRAVISSMWCLVGGGLKYI